MSIEFQTSLSKLERLSPKKLDKTSRRIRGDMADAEWKMGLCLLALKRSGAFRKLGFGTLSAYAERVLQLSGRKVGALLGAAEALEHLPLMSEAFRAGRVCWSKVRVMHGLATPETEAAWLEFARAHTSVEVERKVALSPLEWKRHRALKASLAGAPSVSSGEVKELLLSVVSADCGSGSILSDRVDSRKPADLPQSGDASSEHDDEKITREGRKRHDAVPHRWSGESENEAVGGEAKALSSMSTPAVLRPATPSPPQKIRLVFEMTPDQYALYEQAESRVRAREGRRLPRAEVLKLMAESVLSQGTAKARARHQVLVHTMEGNEKAWYETERGVLPVASEVLEEALGGHEVLLVDGADRVAAAPVSESSRAGRSASKSQGCCGQYPNLPERTNAEDEEPTDRSDRAVDEPLVPQARPGDETAGHETLPLELTVDHTCGSAEEKNTCLPASHLSVSQAKRKAIPNATVRQVFARAGHRCECCGRKGGRLDVHHRDPVSEGGSNDPDGLELLCRACHTKTHEPDFEEKAHWRMARDVSLKSSSQAMSPKCCLNGRYNISIEGPIYNGS